MKKQLFLAGVMALMSLMPVALFAQSTQGTDFWVTFLQADQNDHSDNSEKAITLALTVSATEECDVTFTNPNTKETKSEHLAAGGIKEVSFYTGDGGEYARTRTDSKKASITCYTIFPAQVDTSAIHVEATAPISLFASNRRSKSFDATNVLPTPSLLDEYMIQAVAPSDHQGNPQGTHFAIIATEDNTTVDFCPTAYIQGHSFSMGDTIATPVLNKGQVYYIWTGRNAGATADLSGTWVKARDGKKIAVFQGAPHTNLPEKIRDRDHLFSQAMPIQYWGNNFAITASMTRGRDIVRVMAYEDGTEVRINGKLEHTFDFSTDTKRTFEFEIGKKGVKCTDKDYKKAHPDDQTLPDPLIADSSCFISTSCPAAIHLFMVSNTYDANPVGDPAMVWVNPIEQRINDITFATYGSSNKHYVNIVTDAIGKDSIKLDNKKISKLFHPVAGNDTLYFARTKISYATHRITGAKGFIAHVYGYGDKESYGYSAGGMTKDLTAYITINGEEFKPGEENLICGAEKVDFSCELNYDFDSIYWNFGDGKDSTVLEAVSIEHRYEKNGSYDAYVRIFRPIGVVTECKSWSQNVFDSIAFHVNIGSSQIAWKHTEVPKCILKGQETDIRISLDNPDHVALDGDSVKISFDQKTKDAGFKDDERRIEGDSVLIVHVPGTAEDQVNYAMQIHIGSECPENAFDTTIIFQMVYDIQLLTQRFDHTLGITRDSFPTQTLSNFVWFHDGDTIIGEDKAILQLDRTNPANTGEFIVCFDIEEEGKETVRYCTCPYQFEASESAKDERFGDDANMEISATYVITGNAVFVNAQWGDQTTFDDCYAEWLDVSGRVWQEKKFNLPDGGCLIDAPRERGFYLLRVTTDGGSRSFKFFINH